MNNAKKAIFSYGHRNPQGMETNPFTGEIWTHEHGPKGGDEINIIRIGQAAKQFDATSVFCIVLLLTLFYFEEQSLEEISKVTGLTANNVKVKLFRSRKKLASIFRQQLEPEIIETYGKAF